MILLFSSPSCSSLDCSVLTRSSLRHLLDLSPPHFHPSQLPASRLSVGRDCYSTLVTNHSKPAFIACLSRNVPLTAAIRIFQDVGERVFAHKASSCLGCSQRLRNDLQDDTSRGSHWFWKIPGQNVPEYLAKAREALVGCVDSNIGAVPLG